MNNDVFKNLVVGLLVAIVTTLLFLRVDILNLTK